jgi:ppGpp synthetase/RelA/SpoT-type nucleotidyltranferase
LGYICNENFLLIEGKIMVDNKTISDEIRTDLQNFSNKLQHELNYLLDKYNPEQVNIFIDDSKMNNKLQHDLNYLVDKYSPEQVKYLLDDSKMNTSRQVKVEMAFI